MHRSGSPGRFEFDKLDSFSLFHSVFLPSIQPHQSNSIYHHYHYYYQTNHNIIMARPAEKARAMLNKWVALRNSEQGVGVGGRTGGGGYVGGRRDLPFKASEVEHLADAERGRARLVKRIADAMGKIQNPALGERQLRDLNDEINQFMRQKYHWDKRIKELGGIDYAALEKKRRIEGGGGDGGNDDIDYLPPQTYRYFGAARELPGVPELLQKQREEAASRRRPSQSSSSSAAALYRRIDPDYFGWRDEEDGVLLELEAQADARNRPYRKRPRSYTAEGANEEDEGDDADGDDEDYDDDYLGGPSQSEIEQHLLELKKKALLAKFAL